MKSFDELIEEKIVTRDGVWYNYKQGDKNIRLGRNREAAEKFLLTMDGMSDSPSTLAPISSASSIKKEDPESGGNPEDDLAALAALAAKIVDIKPTSKDELEITYKGISVFCRDKYLDPPYNTILNPVHGLPIEFRWRLRGDKDSKIIDDGDGNYVCNGWQGFLTTSTLYKRLQKDLVFKNALKDSRGLIFVGELVLCIARAEDYRKRQEEKVLAANMRFVKDKDRRKEIGKNIGKFKDPENAMKYVTDINKSDVSEEKTHLQKLAEIEQQKY